MLTILISLISGLTAGYFSFQSWGWLWGVICGLAVFIACQVIISLTVRRKINALQQELNQQIKLGQAKVERKLAMFQQRGNSDVKAARQMIEKEQNLIIREALKTCDRFDPYNKWNPLLARQMNTMRFAFYYQLKDFKAADAISSKCIFFDEHTIAMQLVRLFKNGSDNKTIEKFFRSKIRRLRGDRVVLVFCTYVWIKLRAGENEEAVKLMVEAHSKTTHPVVTDNWERLVNGKFKQFNLSALGELWYSLGLEEPKIQKTRMGRQYI